MKNEIWKVEAENTISLEKKSLQAKVFLIQNHFSTFVQL
jgi:hypothetical protein